MVKPVGTCALPVVNPRNDTKYKVRFLVVKESLTPLLGLDATEKIGLLTVHKENFFSVVENLENDLANKYPDVFDNGLGKLPGKVRRHGDPACQPVILPARKVPVSVKEKFKAELKRLQDLKVIAPVDQPTEWVSQFVVAVKKSGDLRVCIDPKPLNAPSLMTCCLIWLRRVCLQRSISHLLSGSWSWTISLVIVSDNICNSPWEIPLASFTVWFVCLERDISKAFESRVVRPAWCEVYCRWRTCLWERWYWPW